MGCFDHLWNCPWNQYCVQLWNILWSYPNKGTGYCCCDRYLFYILREYYSCDTKVLEKHVWKESYLTHTLPVTERKLILSKVFSAIIISFTTVFIFFAENDILIYIQSIVYHGEASLQGIPIRHFQDFTKTKVVLTILYMIIYGIIWTMHLIYQHIQQICIGQMRSKNRFATMIIVGAFLFLVGYEMQVVLLQHNRYYSWFYLPCLIAFLLEIVLCHLVIEFILTRKLNIN